MQIGSNVYKAHRLKAGQEKYDSCRGKNNRNMLFTRLRTGTLAGRYEIVLNSKKRLLVLQVHPP